MIRSYRDKRSRACAEGSRVKAFQSFKRQAERRLEILDAAMNLADLAALPSNRFEALRGDRRGVRRIHHPDMCARCVVRFEHAGRAGRARCLSADGSTDHLRQLLLRV